MNLANLSLNDLISDGGVINGTGPLTTAPPDPTGGGGSFLRSLLPTLTDGINALASAKINTEVGKILGTGLATVDDEGNVVYKGAPGTPGKAQIAPAYAAKSFFGSTAGLLTLAGVGIGIIVLAVALKD